jgi:hypothetical protein
MTDDKYQELLRRIEECRREASDKGHFFILLMLSALVLKTCR